jgi:hypothetical protein
VIAAPADQQISYTSVARACPAGLGSLGRARGFDQPVRFVANALAATVGGASWEIAVSVRK